MNGMHEGRDDPGAYIETWPACDAYRAWVRLAGREKKGADRRMEAANDAAELADGDMRQPARKGESPTGEEVGVRAGAEGADEGAVADVGTAGAAGVERALVAPVAVDLGLVLLYRDIAKVRLDWVETWVCGREPVLRLSTPEGSPLPETSMDLAHVTSAALSEAWSRSDVN